MTSETLRLERIEDVLLITINRPHRRNAVDYETAKAIEGAVDLLESDRGIALGIVTGADGFFCAGQDVTAAANEGAAVTQRRGGFGIIHRLPEKPLIAAVEGGALGGGLELLLACDLVVASRSSRFALPEATLGYVATGGGLLRLPRRIPYHVAMEMALTGREFSADRMARLGLVNRLSEPGAALAAALDLAGEVARGPAAGLSRNIIRNSVAEAWPESAAWRAQREIAGPDLTRLPLPAPGRHGDESPYP